mmetsp:Transcript_11086/g.37647  ORF Transcript_11086/g.37647 Transcript_11086/m.37647 type:complete len:94 (-) Transcript_11086:1946-2227(-)
MSVGVDRLVGLKLVFLFIVLASFTCILHFSSCENKHGAVYILLAALLSSMLILLAGSSLSSWFNSALVVKVILHVENSFLTWLLEDFSMLVSC